MLTERHYKNEDKIKDMIVDAHRNGTCDRDGKTIKTASGRPIAKPRSLPSTAKTYVFQDGEMVLKE